MDDCMLDLETLGTRPGCVILSIGAVMFDSASGELGAEFYSPINRISSELAGFKVEDAAVAWWSRQGLEARKVLDAAHYAGTPAVETVLQGFSNFIRRHADDSMTARVWGNGADFDNAILGASYDICNSKRPWGHYGARCYRTLKNLLPNVKLQRTELAHHALEDAKYQARHAVLLLKTLKNAVEVQTQGGNVMPKPYTPRVEHSQFSLHPLKPLTDEAAVQRVKDIMDGKL